MNIINQIIIIYSMTYEEYKNKKDGNKIKAFIRKMINKLFTVIIFTMLVIIISNYSNSFRSFVIDKVLNSTMDFSIVNNLIDNFTSIFKSEKETLMVSNLNNNRTEKYLDGIKYFVSEDEEVFVKDSGIVTFIGNKTGYNNTIIIQQSNGYYAWYGNIKESVKLYDYLEKGSSLGRAENEYYYVLLKDDKPININES